MGALAVTTIDRARLVDLVRELGGNEVYVISTYGFTEAKMAFPECPVESGASGFHLSPDLALVELVDPRTGRPVAPGHPGEIVFTPLDARGTLPDGTEKTQQQRGGEQIILHRFIWLRCGKSGRNAPFHAPTKIGKKIVWPQVER